MIKDIDTMKQGERFDYVSIDVDYLRTLELLPNWLKRNPHARTIIKHHPASHNNQPPGHPKVLRYKPDNWRSNIPPVYVLPDPENFSWVDVEYEKSKKYIPDGDFNSVTREHDDYRTRYNKYYVLTPPDYRKLWIPLSWDNPRMQVWEADTYYYYGQMYKKDDGETFHDYYISKVYKPLIDQDWKETVIARKWAEYHLAKFFEERSIKQEREKYVHPERNLAVLHIRKWFKDYQPNMTLIKDPKNSSAWDLIEPYRWYYLYASPEDMYNDPIWRVRHNADKWLKDK